MISTFALIGGYDCPHLTNVPEVMANAAAAAAASSPPAASTSALAAAAAAATAAAAASTSAGSIGFGANGVAAHASAACEIPMTRRSWKRGMKRK